VDLRWTWLALLLLVLVPLAIWWTVRRASEDIGDGLPVAHAARLRALPRYQVLVRRQLAWTIAQLAAAALVLLGSILLAARPTEATVVDPPAEPGDLVLCFDVSPAMRDEASTALAQVRTQLARLAGSRIALYGYQDTTAELMPMTDDYAFVDRRLREAQQALTGLSSGGVTGGNTGDGLVSCAQHFDRPAAERGRAVVLLTPGGNGSGGLHTLSESATYASGRDVVVYAVAPADAPDRDQLEAAAERTGGRAVDLGPRAARQVLDFEADRLDDPPGQIDRDRPMPALVLTIVGLLALLGTGLRGWLR
jgi:Ca-activated chloride channel homolog